MIMYSDIDTLEEEILAGKFKTKTEVTQYVAREHTGPSVTTSALWRNTLANLMPEARRAYKELPQQPTTLYYSGEPTRAAQQALLDGECENRHPIRGKQDLAPNGKGKLSCLRCRIERARRYKKGVTLRG